MPFAKIYTYIYKLGALFSSAIVVEQGSGFLCHGRAALFMFAVPPTRRYSNKFSPRERLTCGLYACKVYMYRMHVLYRDGRDLY